MRQADLPRARRSVQRAGMVAVKMTHHTPKLRRFYCAKSRPGAKRITETPTDSADVGPGVQVDGRSGGVVGQTTEQKDNCRRDVIRLGETLERNIARSVLLAVLVDEELCHLGAGKPGRQHKGFDAPLAETAGDGAR